MRPGSHEPSAVEWIGNQGFDVGAFSAKKSEASCSSSSHRPVGVAQQGLDLKSGHAAASRKHKIWSPFLLSSRLTCPPRLQLS
eukprot:607155-Hanusia_phi.AAC.8